jgi:hypothetical protein
VFSCYRAKASFVGFSAKAAKIIVLPLVFIDIDDVLILNPFERISKPPEPNADSALDKLG